MSDYQKNIFYISVQTWVRNMYHGFTDRCFRVVDEDGNLLAHSVATLALMDLRNRASVDLNGDIGQRLLECILPDEPFPMRRIPPISRSSVGEVAFRRRPQYSDVDINGHMNSIRTLEHILDSFPLGYMNSHTPVGFVVSYMQEGEATEELTYGITRLEENRFLAQVTKENGAVASRCELTFKQQNI